jgi:type II restriction enzyme
VFKSRAISPDKFIEEFFQTLTPGVIPRNHFIDWNRIKTKCTEFEDVIEYFAGLNVEKPSALVKEIEGSLLAADDPFHLVKGTFELLGHTNDYYVSDKDNADFEKLSEKIKKGSSETAAYVAQLLIDLGLPRIILKKDIESAFLGVQVGLESNRRKSVGGETFNQWVRELLESTCALLGRKCEVQPEVIIPYKDSKNGKKVDFALSSQGKVRIGVEVNFYTTSGSKPSEIKRAYQSVNRELSMVGVELVWITDGAGYLKMKRGLREAFEAHRNTYNYEMARRYLKEDILDFLS